jgi:glycopeptide antibiotics resistance protein
MNRINILWIIALIVSVIMILYMTLSPGVVKKGINLIPFKDNAVFVRAFFAHGGMSRQDIPRWVFLNLFGNLVLFMPFGFFLTGFLAQSSFRSSYLIVALFGCLLSLGIELLQLFIPTRATDIDDVILNTVSTCLGVMVFFMLRSLLFALYSRGTQYLKLPVTRVDG